ncbi:hypothetical protein Dimus_014143 [Dionaea muscipula]
MGRTCYHLLILIFSATSWPSRKKEELPGVIISLNALPSPPQISDYWEAARFHNLLCHVAPVRYIIDPLFLDLCCAPTCHTGRGRSMMIDHSTGACPGSARYDLLSSSPPPS